MSKTFVYKKNMSIGSPAAEDDKYFLSNCFINTGDIDSLIDTSSSKCIILGRTGSGKSAIIQHIIETDDNIIEIMPEELSLSYICNSDILKYFINIGINLDVFFQLLWRHILTVELIRNIYKIKSTNEATSFFSSISDRFSRDEKKIAAINYLKQWGESFWVDVEHRIVEITKKLESKLCDSVNIGNNKIAQLRLADSDNLSLEEKGEILNKSQSVVNDIQMKELSIVMDMLGNEILIDSMKKYYITIDRLDENWVDDSTRYKLIRALIETIKPFRRIQNVKIIIALRTDLFDRVIDATRDSGFQSEKYEAFILRLNWNREQLKDLVDNRIDYLFKSKYTKESAKFVDIFPHKLKGKLAFEYIIERTMYRPRDIISFVNECLEKAQGKTEITPKIVYSAEGAYSEKRLNALRDEWIVDHQLLLEYCSVRKKKSSNFIITDVSNEEIDSLIVRLIESQGCEKDKLYTQAAKCLNGYCEFNDFITEWACALYKIGIVGIKLESYNTIQWSYEGASVIPRNLINKTSTLYVHPMVWRSLGISDAIEAQEE